MEKEHNPPPYYGPQTTQTGINYPGPQAPYPPQPGQIIFRSDFTKKNQPECNIINLTLYNKVPVANIG